MGYAAATGSLAVQPFDILLGALAPFFLAPVPVWGAGQALPQTAEPVPCSVNNAG